MRLNESQLQFLASFAVSPVGRAYVQLLQERLAAHDAKLRSSTGEEVFRQQGRALELAELIGDITGTSKTLERQRSSPQPPAIRALA